MRTVILEFDAKHFGSLASPEREREGERERVIERLRFWVTPEFISLSWVSKSRGASLLDPSGRTG
jgi:hypothetical protein